MKTMKSEESFTSKTKSATMTALREAGTLAAAKAPASCGVQQVGKNIIFTTFCPDAATVQVAGDFNNWKPEQNPMKKISAEGVWQLKLKLKSGNYQYRLVVDGNWQQDPFNNHSEPNPYGQFNSVVTVK